MTPLFYFLYFFGVLSYEIVTTKTVMTKTCHQKGTHNPHILEEINKILVQLCNSFCILVCFRVLVCELKFCNVMWSLPKHYCHYWKCAVTTETWDVLSKIKYTELSTKMLFWYVFGSMYIKTNKSLTLKSVWSTFCHLQIKIKLKIQSKCKCK